jgi:hypothetical protein
MPIVSITIVNAGWPRMGRITTRSSTTPNRPIATTAASTAIQNGKPRNVISARPMKAPSIIRSPWTKLTVSVVL